MLTLERFTELVSDLPYKKVLPDAVYLHRQTLETTSPALSQFVCAVAKALKIPDDQWHVVKLAKKDFRLSLLSYPTFFEDSYPCLYQSVTVNLEKLKHTITRYDVQDNPPILHRKETMIWPEHPQYQQFIDITKEGELAGLYEQPRMIGFKQSWLRIIEKNGYDLIDGRIIKTNILGNDKQVQTIDRHKTALTRYQLSAPMKLLARHGYLNGEYSIFDYGCGKGDDLRELEAHGLDVLGWDPNFRPDGDKVTSQLVNLGYVINVIEDRDERIDALISAWELTETLLVVSAMIANDQYISQFTPYRDGVITTRNTFQKYYNQSELRSFIERTLDEVPLAIAPGIFFIFRDKNEEQTFLMERQRRHHAWRQLSVPAKNNLNKHQQLLQNHSGLFEAFWQQTLNLGRIPANDEFDRLDELKKLVGSPIKALRLLEEQEGTGALEQAKKERTEDLLVYLALGLFEKRKPYSRLNESLKRDIKAFFNDYNHAQTEATTLLYAIADRGKIQKACEEAHTTLPASLLHTGHSLTLDKTYLTQLPALLRVYVGAGTQLYGELDDIDLIKIHITSGKVSLMGYDDFDKPIPFLVERVKIKMAEQEVEYFDYMDEKTRPPLLVKSKLISKTNEAYKTQLSLEKRIEKILDLDLNQETYIKRTQYEEALSKAGVTLKGSKLFKINTTH